MMKEKHAELEKDRLYGPEGALQPKNKAIYDKLRNEQKTYKQLKQEL